jgi:hypothetical protein
LGRRRRPGRQIKQRPIIRTDEGGIEPGAQLREIQLVRIDASQDRGPDEDLASRVVFTGTAGGKGARPGIEALLTDFQMLELCLEAMRSLNGSAVT